MHSFDIQQILSEVATLYGKLPAVDCEGCGCCCVSPTCTLVEFMYLMNGIMHDPGQPENDVFFHTPVVLHDGYEGNTRCMFLKDKRCLVHVVRTGACRLFGIPSVERMEIPGMVRCLVPRDKKNGGFSMGDVKRWLKELIMLNRRLYPMGEAPYFLTGLTIECWMDIWLAQKWEQPFFSHLQELLRSACPPVVFEGRRYELRTGIDRKIDMIDRFFSMIDGGDAREMQGILVRIRDEFPFTGTWYFEEANRFLSEIGRYRPVSV